MTQTVLLMIVRDEGYIADGDESGATSMVWEITEEIAAEIIGRFGEPIAETMTPSVGPVPADVVILDGETP